MLAELFALNSFSLAFLPGTFIQFPPQSRCGSLELWLLLQVKEEWFATHFECAGNELLAP